jgi:hypothetical protein
LFFFFASYDVMLHQLVSKPKLLSMAPLTRGMGNCYANLNEVYERKESVHEELAVAHWQHMEEQLEVMRGQMEALTTNLTNMGGHNRHLHQPHFTFQRRKMNIVMGMNWEPIYGAPSPRMSTSYVNSCQTVGEWVQI